MPEFDISPEQHGLRLDLALRVFLPQISRTFLQRLVAQHAVLVNGQPTKSSSRVQSGDRVSVVLPETKPLELVPENIPLDMLFEDDDLIVVNKPAGMVVHPAAGNWEHTMVHALLHHCRGRLSGIGGVRRPGIVHRIDKGTSGCIVAAKTEAAHRGLTRQFKDRSTQKVYRALCWGVFEMFRGKVDAPIGRCVHDRKKMASRRVVHGREALTEYKVLHQVRGDDKDTLLPGLDYALVELIIHTGRTHQIRVHMAHIGHPVMGDSVYGRSPTVRRMNEQLGIRRADFSVARPMLHAYKLGFTHPVNGAWLMFTAPVPPEMARWTPAYRD